MTESTIKTFAEQTPDVTAFHSACVWTGAKAAERARWLDMRREILTASDMACVLGHGYKGRDALAVYAEKISPAKAEEKLRLDDPRFWGSVLEQPILRAVAEYYGWGYRPGGYLLQSRESPWLGCTLDAEVDMHDGSGWCDFEGKTSMITRDWNEETDDLPTRVLIQVQDQLLVSGAPKGVVFALLQGARPCQITIWPNEELFKLMREEGQEFMDRVQRLDPPAPTEHSKEALERLYPTSDGSSILLPDMAVDWTRELKDIREQTKRLESRSEELKNLLRASIGEHLFGVLPEPVDGMQFWRWKEQQRDGYVVAPTSFRALLNMKNGPSPEAASPPRSFEEILEASSLGAAAPAEATKRKRASSRR